MEINGSNFKKNMKLPISIIILTYNEEKNIEACLKSVCDFAQDIFIVDSFSTDRTLEIVKEYTDKIFQHPFETQAKQFNWALENLVVKADWVMRLDADEYVTKELKDELYEKLLTVLPEVTGLYVKRRVYFMRRWIRFGGYYPIWLLRIWRNKKAVCEERYMDEHIAITEGKVNFLENDIVEENQKDLHMWIEKHNFYSIRETIDLLNLKYKFFTSNGVTPDFFGTQEQRKRWLKKSFYSRLPLFIRTFLYFIYRYIFRLGFLDGKEGLIWHFLQGCWYRFLVDAKVYEIEKRTLKENKMIQEVIKEVIIKIQKISF